MMNYKTKKEPNVLACILIKGCPEIKYIQYTNSKINRCPGILKKIKNYVQVKALKKTYLTLLQNPMLTTEHFYGEEQLNDTLHIDKSFKILMHIMLFQGKYDSVKQLYK